MRTALMLCTIILCLSALALAAEPPGDLPVAKTKVRTLAAFKNGLGFVFRSGETDLKDGWAVLDELPSASLGALWIGTATPPLRVDEVVSSKGTSQREAEAMNLGELLEANVGRRVKLKTVFGSGEPSTVVEGVILSAPVARKPDGLVSSESYRGGSLPGQVVTLKGDDGVVLAIDKNVVRAIELAADSPWNARVTRDVDVAKIHLVGPRGADSNRSAGAKAEVTMAYLEKGITWSPSYLINIASEKEAEITLEAVLANDVEDIEDAEVSFVVGYPNFMYSDFTTLLDAQQSVASFVQSLMSGPRADRSAGAHAAALSQSVMYNVASYDADSRWRPGTAYSTKPMPGETNEDLYFYRRDHVTLKKGDRARYTVFTAKAPYKHIYQWDVPDTSELDYRGYRRDSDEGKEQPDQVWHAIKIENTTSQPWTTAPALAVNDSMPVAQDVLRYTPPKGSSTLKLTVATDVRAEQSQTELSRELVKIGYHEYDAVTVSGILTVKNLKSKGISMEVKKVLAGEVLESSQGSKSVRVAKRVTAVNPESQIEWQFQLPAGGEMQLTYKYKMLVAR